MELDKQKNISMVIHNTLKRADNLPKISVEIGTKDLKNVLEYAVFLEKEIGQLQKNAAELQRNNAELQKENKILQSIKYATANCLDIDKIKAEECERWKDKIRDCLDDIEDYFERVSVPYEDIEFIKEHKKDLLKGE